MQASKEKPFYLTFGNIHAIPICHYNMEMASQVRLAFDVIKPDCVAVELPENMQLQLLHAASRLPDISLVTTYKNDQSPIYYLCEPCEPCFEALRSAIESGITARCIDLDVENYPDFQDLLPDPYAIFHIGLKEYYGAYKTLILDKGLLKCQDDLNRELHMAKKLKELSLCYDSVLFVGGMAHIESIFSLINRTSFPISKHVERPIVQLCTLTEKSCRDVLGEYGWISKHYETLREKEFPDRQKLIYDLLKEAAIKYTKNTGHEFPQYHMRNLMKFIRNYALVTDRLMPSLFQLLNAAKGCVDHNYAYEVWELATEYPHLKNIDGLIALDLSIEDLWGKSQIIRFHMKMKNEKSSFSSRLKKDRSKIRFQSPNPFGICSYQPEDTVIERFGEFLKKKGTQLLMEESACTIPFSTSIEDGIDTRETIRHWHEKKIYVKTKGKPQGNVGSIVMIFDPDQSEETLHHSDKYPWVTTWIGEHNQESDMAFYATPLENNLVGPGISRCEYGGFMMSYPPKRLYDIWNDPDYSECRSNSEVLLMAAIDYSIQPLISYVAKTPPRSALKTYAHRFGKKIIYIPIGQLSPITLNKLRVFHVLDGHHTRNIADEYIF